MCIREDLLDDPKSKGIFYMFQVAALSQGHLFENSLSKIQHLLKAAANAWRRELVGTAHLCCIV
jgi:hypothetical protein